MKNSDYWKRRFELLEASANKDAVFTYQGIEEQFIKAQREVESQIQSWYSRFATNNQISMAEARRLLNTKELAEFRWDVKEYIKYGEQIDLNPTWMKQLENASAKFHVSRLEALKIQTQHSMEVLYGNQLDSVDKLLKRTYLDGYYHTAYEIQKGFNIGWDIASIDQSKLEKIISKPWAADGKNFSDRIWTNRQSLIGELHTQLTQTCILGKSPDDAIKAIAKKFGTNDGKKITGMKFKAARVVMTESAYFASASQKDAFNELDVERFEIVATLDSDTSAICQEMDGKVFLMKDYEPGVTAHPFHVFCRSCTVPYFEDNYGGERAARGKGGKTYYVPDSTKYSDWKKTFTEGGSKNGLKSTSESDIITNKTLFTPASTIKEAEEYARNTFGVQNVSYEGVDIVTANAWNKGLVDTFNKFPQLKNQFGFVGECHERNIMLKPVAKQHYLDELGKLNPDASVAQLEPYANKYVNKLMRDMSVSKKTMAESWSPKLDVFKPFRGVTVNRDFGKNASLFVDNLKRTVESKFHPTGCNAIRSVLDHEIGHQLDDLLDISNIPDIQKLFDGKTHNELTDVLSEYTWNNSNPDKYSEMIAEAWAEYCNNPTPREIAKTVGQAIETAYKTKFGTS